VLVRRCSRRTARFARCHLRVSTNQTPRALRLRDAAPQSTRASRADPPPAPPALLPCLALVSLWRRRGRASSPVGGSTATGWRSRTSETFTTTVSATVVDHRTWSVAESRARRLRPTYRQPSGSPVPNARPSCRLRPHSDLRMRWSRTSTGSTEHGSPEAIGQHAILSMFAVRPGTAEQTIAGAASLAAAPAGGSRKGST
jgi:hypothetical protein